MTNTHHDMLVFGEALVDDFITEQVVGGAPFNVARNLAAFGLAPRMITRIGVDKAGALVSAEFDRFGLSRDCLQVDDTEATGRVVVERTDGDHRFIILPNQAYDHIAPLPDSVAQGATTIYFGTLAQRTHGSRAALQQLLRASRAERYLDLNVRVGQVTERCVYESLREADIVKVNEEELQDLFGWYTHTRHDTADMNHPGLRSACASLLRTFSLTMMIVTLGARGAVLFQSDGPTIVSAPSAPPVKLVDTVGAGDAFSAVFLLGRSRGWPLATTLARANEFAGAVCTITGAVPADLAFYTPYLACWARADAKARHVAA